MEHKLKLYNTYTRKTEEFKPVKDGQTRIYSCGPTVYDYVHIGNLRTYLLTDVLKRVLQHDGYQVEDVMNITDVGHLTGDSDAGEDKMEKGAKNIGKTVWDVARFYEQAFKGDIELLNIRPAKFYPRATEHVKDQITLIEKLQEKGFVYETPEALYFDVSKFPEYTKLSGQKLEDKLTGARSEVVKDEKKRNPADFALWFRLVGKFENHTMHWPSPWGEGFPGWHLECSAMSTKYLGQPFDIHVGGIDLVMPHHTNEIAQSTAAFDKPLANYWVHGEHLLIDKSKMAKSEGNFLRLQTLIDKGFSPLAFRYLVLGAHYRTKLNFTWESLEAAQNALDHLYEKISELEGEASVAMCEDYARAFEREINNDLDMPRVLSLTWRLMKKPNPDKLKLSTLKKFDDVLGLDLLANAAERKKIPAEAKQLASEREKFRAKKDFASADKIRDELLAQGYEIKDTESGPLLRKTK